MCGRFTLRTPATRVAELFDLEEIPILEPRYNIAPTQPVAALRLAPSAGSPKIELIMLRWGLIPFWAKDPKVGARSINARSESVEEKPTFRDAFQKRRCLILADGFYEWRKEGKTKQPYHIHFFDDRLLAFAGLWDRWRSADGDIIESCTILTTSAGPQLSHLHERMPVILHRRDQSGWLDGSAGAEVLVPYTDDDFVLTAVSSVVNSVKNDSPACLAPHEETKQDG